jgi:hypothetical protein
VRHRRNAGTTSVECSAVWRRWVRWDGAGGSTGHRRCLGENVTFFATSASAVRSDSAMVAATRVASAAEGPLFWSPLMSLHLWRSCWI